MRMYHNTIVAGAISIHQNAVKDDEKSKHDETGKPLILYKFLFSRGKKIFKESIRLYFCCFFFCWTEEKEKEQKIQIRVRLLFESAFCTRRCGKSIQLYNRNIFHFDGEVLWFPCECHFDQLLFILLFRSPYVLNFFLSVYTLCIRKTSMTESLTR